MIKAKEIIGHSIILRDATMNDAEFILSLRNDEKKSKFLSQTSADLSLQQKWLINYSQDPTQAYFIIYTKDDRKIGTVRIYDIIGDSFCWGSWILTQDAPTCSSIESALVIYQYALACGFNKAHFDVRKGNSSVYRFHERFGAIKISENDEDYFFNINKEAITNSLSKYRKYLPVSIKIKPY